MGLLSAHVLSQEVHIPRLITPPEKGQDLEQRVIDTYIIQCQAEAQEGTRSQGILTTPTVSFVSEQIVFGSVTAKKHF